MAAGAAPVRHFQTCWTGARQQSMEPAPNQLIDTMQDLIDFKCWIECSTVRARELGWVQYIEVLNVPQASEISASPISSVRRELREIDRKVLNLVITVVNELPDCFSEPAKTTTTGFVFPVSPYHPLF